VDIVTNVLLAAGLVWLLALTVLMAGIIRYVGAIEAAGGSRQAPDGGFLVDLDGPWVPSALPKRSIDVLRRNGIQSEDLIVTFFSSGCAPCLERASQVARKVADPARNLFLVTGARQDLVEDMQARLRPASTRILRDPDAHDFVKALDVQSTPFVFRIMNDQVVDKAYLRDAEDYRQLAERSFQSATPIAIPNNGGPA